MLDINKRLSNLESMLSLISNEYNTNLATHNEIEAARQEIFNEIEQLQVDVSALEKTIEVITQITTTAQGR